MKLNLFLKPGIPLTLRYFIDFNIFVSSCIRVLSDMTGTELYGLTRDNCENLLGKEEGGKLFSQIRLCKAEENVSSIFTH